MKGTCQAAKAWLKMAHLAKLPVLEDLYCCTKSMPKKPMSTRPATHASAMIRMPHPVCSSSTTLSDCRHSALPGTPLQRHAMTFSIVCISQRQDISFLILAHLGRKPCHVDALRAGSSSIKCDNSHTMLLLLLPWPPPCASVLCTPAPAPTSAGAPLHTASLY